VFKPSAVFATDSYKLGHMVQYPEGTELVYSNFTPRTAKYSPVPAELDDGKIVVFGVQSLVRDLRDFWEETFFKVDWDTIKENLEEATASFVGDAGFEQGIENFRKLHNLGYLPLLIKAIDEGEVISPKVPMLTMCNTHPDFYWLTNYIETWISQELWKMPTVATIARAYRRLVTKYAIETGAPLEFCDWQCHDFSARGLCGMYDNGKVGAAHLTSFKGTDSLLGVQFINQYYDGKQTFVGGSVPATEHSVMCMGGKEDELETYRRLITMYESGIVSIVSDTYDFWKVITEYVAILKEDILNRKPDSMGMAKVVFRPDSGDPVKIICGDPDADVGTPAHKGAVECLWDVFGGTTTANGYKVLNERVGLIYGDSITLKRASEILEGLKAKGFSSNNIVFGIGSYSYQGALTRDTFGFAMKATYGLVNDEGREIFKDPVTDDGTKKSAVGMLRVEKDEAGEYRVFDRQNTEQEMLGELKIVFFNGFLGLMQPISLIRQRILDSIR